MAKKGLVKTITEEIEEFSGGGIEATKGIKEDIIQPEMVTCDDVLKNLRSKGYKI